MSGDRARRRPACRARRRGRRSRAPRGRGAGCASSSAIDALAELAGGGAVGQAPLDHRLAGEGFERHRVEHRLQHAPAVHDGGRRRAVLPGLVVGDAQRACRRRAARRGRSSRAARKPASPTRDRLAHRGRRRGAASSGRPKASSKRSAPTARRRARPCSSNHSRRSRRRPSISSSPHALDGRRQVVVGRASHRGDGPVELPARAGGVAGRERQHAVLHERAEERRLDLVEQAAARQRIEPLQRRRSRRAAPAGRSPRAGTGTGTRRSAAAPTASRGAP